MPEARSVAVGFWVGVGSRDEPDELAGASHFLEHLLFKGTEDRVGPRDRRGRRRGRRRDERLHRQGAHGVLRPAARRRSSPLAVDLLADVVVDPAFRADEVEVERQVILEELRQPTTSPTTASTSPWPRRCSPDHPLGREVLGTEDTVAAHAAATRSPTSTTATTGPTTSSSPRPAPSTTTTSSTGVAERLPCGRCRRPRRRRTPPGRRGRCPSPSSTARPSRPTSLWAGARCPPTTPTATPSRWSTRCSAAACRAGCSRRSARSGAWPTRSTSSPSPASDAGLFAVYAGTAPTGVRRCSS